MLAELNGLTGPNGYGHLPLGDLDPARPAVKDGPANDYWDFVDEVLDLAAANGLYTGFLPTWGKCVTSSAFAGKSKDAVYGDCLEELDASIGTPSATKKHREHSLL